MLNLGKKKLWIIFWEHICIQIYFYEISNIIGNLSSERKEMNDINELNRCFFDGSKIWKQVRRIPTIYTRCAFLTREKNNNETINSSLGKINAMNIEYRYIAFLHLAHHKCTLRTKRRKWLIRSLNRTNQWNSIAFRLFHALPSCIVLCIHIWNNCRFTHS